MISENILENITSENPENILLALLEIPQANVLSKEEVEILCEIITPHFKSNLQEISTAAKAAYDHIYRMHPNLILPSKPQKSSISLRESITKHLGEKPETLALIAKRYHLENGDFESAKYFYSQIIERFPNSQFSIDARLAVSEISEHMSSDKSEPQSLAEVSSFSSNFPNVLKGISIFAALSIMAFFILRATGLSFFNERTNISNQFSNSADKASSFENVSLKPFNLPETLIAAASYSKGMEIEENFFSLFQKEDIVGAEKVLLTYIQTTQGEVCTSTLRMAIEIEERHLKTGAIASAHFWLTYLQRNCGSSTTDDESGRLVSDWISPRLDFIEKGGKRYWCFKTPENLSNQIFSAVQGNRIADLQKILTKIDPCHSNWASEVYTDYGIISFLEKHWKPGIKRVSQDVFQQDIKDKKETLYLNTRGWSDLGNSYSNIQFVMQNTHDGWEWSGIIAGEEDTPVSGATEPRFGQNDSKPNLSPNFEDQVTTPSYTSQRGDWLLFPKEMSWYETQTWVKSLPLGWKSPNSMDIMELYKEVGNSKPFKGKMFWAEPFTVYNPSAKLVNDGNAIAFSFNRGQADQVSRGQPLYGIAVRLQDDSPFESPRNLNFASSTGAEISFFYPPSVEWKIGPDRDYSFSEAQSWVSSLGQGWKLPNELKLWNILLDRKAKISRSEEHFYWSQTNYNENDSYEVGISLKTNGCWEISNDRMTRINGRVIAYREKQLGITETGSTFSSREMDWQIGNDNISWDETQRWIKKLGNGWRTPRIEDFKVLQKEVGLNSPLNGDSCWAEFLGDRAAIFDFSDFSNSLCFQETDFKRQKLWAVATRKRSKAK